MTIEVTLVSSGSCVRWAGGHGNDAEAQQHPRGVGLVSIA